jgi:glyceraldehyde-3-phosphate dehydrogenase (ferredoxin)
LSTDRIHSQAWRVKEKLEMHDNKHELMLDGTTGFYRVQRYRVGDFFGPVDLGIHLAFKHNALTIGAGLFPDPTGLYSPVSLPAGTVFMSPPWEGRP